MKDDKGGIILSIAEREPVTKSVNIRKENKMKSLVEEYCMISLNGERVNENTCTMKIKNKCISAAVLFQIFLENSQNYALTIDGIKSMPENVKRALNLLERPVEDISVKELLDGMKKLTHQDFAEIARFQIENFIKCGEIEEVSALLECDLNYQNTGVRLFEYRSDSQNYFDTIANIREEIFGSEKISDERMFLIWLLNESLDLFKIFDASETGFLNEMIEQTCREKKVFKTLFENTIVNKLDKIEMQFLKEKEKWAKTEIGLGVVSRMPILQKSESIFIETQKMFADHLHRIKAVEERVKEKGHLFELISSGSKTAIVKIDNSYYELIPDAVRVYLTNIHGVRLRRCGHFKN